MNKLLVSLCLLSVGCAVAHEPEPQLGPLDVWAFPLDSQIIELHRPDVEAAWLERGLPPLDNCPQEYAVVLAPDRAAAFAKFCTRPSCSVAWVGQACAWSCTRPLNGGQTPIMTTMGDVDMQHEEAHELMHMWARCTTGDGDHEHVRSELWSGVMSNF